MNLNFNRSKTKLSIKSKFFGFGIIVLLSGITFTLYGTININSSKKEKTFILFKEKNDSLKSGDEFRCKVEKGKLRKQPSSRTGKWLYTINKNDVLIFTGIKSSGKSMSLVNGKEVTDYWLQVLYNGDKVWIFGGCVEKIDKKENNPYGMEDNISSVNTMAIVIANRVCLRKSPHINGQKYSIYLNKDDVVLVSSSSDSKDKVKWNEREIFDYWYYITELNGEPFEAWVFGEALEFIDSSNKKNLSDYKRGKENSLVLATSENYVEVIINDLPPMENNLKFKAGNNIGMIKLQVCITPKGKVTHVRILQNTLNDNELLESIEEKIQRSYFQQTKSEKNSCGSLKIEIFPPN